MGPREAVALRAPSARPPNGTRTTWPWKYIAFWLARVSRPASVIAIAVAYGMWVWSTQRAVGRARCTARWIMKAVTSQSPSPSTTRPSRSISRMSAGVISDQCGP